MLGFGSKTAHYNQNSHTPTQKMPKAFFVSDPGNRQQATGNYTHLLSNRVNQLTAYFFPLFNFYFTQKARPALHNGSSHYFLARRRAHERSAAFVPSLGVTA